MPDYTHAIYTSVKNTWQDAENLDASLGYTTYIWIPEETFTVDKMKLHIYSEKFRAHSKSALGGGAAVKTSSEGGAHSHDVTLATSSASSESTTEGGGAHSHDVTLATSAPTGNTVEIIAIGTTTTAYAHESNERTTGGPSATVQASRVAFGACPLGHSGCSVTGHVSVYPGSQTHTHEIPALAAFNVPDVYNELTLATQNHVHTVSGQTAEAVGTHTHGMAHTHTVSGQTAEAVANHTHTVTLTDHTHAIEFGIYEEAITGRTLSAILYDPDDNELKDFGVVLTGEDDDIIDLTSYFATLTYGMYKVVLSASGRLRARLVFYELCKMYAQY